MTDETLNEERVEFLDYAAPSIAVFEGGGVKGYAYINAIRNLRKTRGPDGKTMLDHLKFVGGSSAGGITALLLGLGLGRKDDKDPDSINAIMEKMDFTEFQDGGPEYWKKIPDVFDKATGGLVKGTAKKASEAFTLLTRKKKGLYKGDVFLQWAREMVAKVTGNPDATFADLRKLMNAHPELGLKEMMFTACNLSQDGEPMNFDADSTPNVRIADAVRATMSYPGAFEPHEIEVDGTKYLFADGGINSNYPVEYYEDKAFIEKSKHKLTDDGRNPNLIGFRVDSRKEQERFWGIERGGHRTDKIGAGKMVGATIGGLASDIKKVKKYGLQTVTIDDCDIPTLKFQLTPEDKKALNDSSNRAFNSWYERTRSKKYKVVHKNVEEYYSSLAERDPSLLANKRKQLEQAMVVVNTTLDPKNVFPPEAIEKARSRQDHLRLELEAIEKVESSLRKLPQEEALDKAKQIIDQQKKLLSYSQDYLEYLLQQAEKASQNIHKVRETDYKKFQEISALGSKDPTQKVIHNTFNQMKTLKDQFQKKHIELESQFKNKEITRENLQFELKDFWDKRVKSIVDNINTKAYLGENQRKLIIEVVRKELNHLKNSPFRNFNDCLEHYEAQLKKLDNSLDRIEKFKVKCTDHINKNVQYRKEIEGKVKLHGENFSKMLETSRNFDRFLKREKTTWEKLGTLAKIAVGVAAVVFSPLTIPTVLGYGVYRLHKYHTNEAICKRTIKKLRGDIQDLIHKWNSNDPSVDITQYIKLLQDSKEKLVGLKWAYGEEKRSKSSTKVVLQTIETELKRIDEHKVETTVNKAPPKKSSQ